MTAPAVRRRGRPMLCPEPVLHRVVTMKVREKLSLRRIADVLNAEGVPTPSGKDYWWYPNVGRLLATDRGIELAEAMSNAN